MSANELELLDAEPAVRTDAPLAVTDNSPMGMMLAATRQGASLEQVEKMMDLQERWERREAEKAFNDAMAAFKGEAIEIIKRKRVHFANAKGGVTDYKHAELSDVIEAAGPALSRLGFSWGWKTKQANDHIEVSCILKHKLGHSESATLSAPYDTSGGKNAIQAIISAKTYLERHTFKAICGLAEKGEDDDGKGSGASLSEIWVGKATLAKTVEEMATISKDGTKAFNDAKDTDGYKVFAAAVQVNGAALRKLEAGRA
ncbi:MAG: ERF family protein [Rhodocyclaceae bacterium]